MSAAIATTPRETVMRRADAHDHPAEDVAAEHVGAEEVRAARREVPVGDVRDAGALVRERRDPGAEDRQQDESGDDQEADQREPVPAEDAAPGTPACRRLRRPRGLGAAGGGQVRADARGAHQALALGSMRAWTTSTTRLVSR